MERGEWEEEGKEVESIHKRRDGEEEGERSYELERNRNLATTQLTHVCPLMSS